MSSQVIQVETLTAEKFRPYGDVLETKGSPTAIIINNGLCQRYHNLAHLTFAGEGKAGLSLFDAIPRSLPYRFDLLERHPLGSQAFIPMSVTRFLVIVAPDHAGIPGHPKAFLTELGQGINFHAGTWHGVLTPLSAPGLFAVVDRIGSDNNLEEFIFQQPFTVVQND